MSYLPSHISFLWNMPKAMQSSKSSILSNFLLEPQISTTIATISFKWLRETHLCIFPFLHSFLTLIFCLYYCRVIQIYQAFSNFIKTMSTTGLRKANTPHTNPMVPVEYFSFLAIMWAQFHTVNLASALRHLFSVPLVPLIISSIVFQSVIFIGFSVNG